jgi:hypothetical protein
VSGYRFEKAGNLAEGHENLRMFWVGGDILHQKLYFSLEDKQRSEEDH